jgi:hypothetical protein
LYLLFLGGDGDVGGGFVELAGVVEAVVVGVVDFVVDVPEGDLGLLLLRGGRRTISSMRHL